MRTKNPRRGRFEKKSEKKNCERPRKKIASAASQSEIEKGETNKETQSSSTTRKQQKEKLKKVDMSIKPEDILDKFQNRNPRHLSKPSKWKTQVLKMGVQKLAHDLRGKNQSAGKRDERFDPPNRRIKRHQHGRQRG